MGGTTGQMTRPVMTERIEDVSSKETLLNAAVLYWMHDLAAQGIITTDSELNVVEWNHWMANHTGETCKRSNR